MKIYTGYPGGITKITNDKGFYQTEDLANVISVYVNQADVTGITYTLALEFLRADGRKTTIYTEDSFASGEATTLTEDNVTYDIHNFTLTNTQLAVAGALAFTCYINILNSGVVEKRGVLFNAVSNVRKTVTYSANTIFVVSEDDEDVPTIVEDMKTAIENLSGQLASKVNKAEVASGYAEIDGGNVDTFQANDFILNGLSLKDTLFDYNENVDITNTLTLTNYYLDKANGNANPDSNSKCTNYIDLSTYTGFWISGHSQYATTLICTYDENKTFLRSYGDGTSAGQTFTDYEYIPQSDEKFVRFSTYQYTQYPLKVVSLGVFAPINKEKQDNYLYNKKYVACGDSFTKGDVIAGTKVYPYLIAQRNNMRLVNMAHNGSYCHYGENGFTNPNNSYYYQNIPLDADIITIAYGLNETSTTIGTKDSVDNTTIWGAYNEVLGWITTNIPNAKVGIISNDAWMTYDLRNALQEIASYWGVEFLDLKEYGKPFMISGKYSQDGDTNPSVVSQRTTQYCVSSQNGHPNELGHKVRSYVVENFLRGMDATDNRYTKKEVETKLNLKADKSTTYTKTEVNGKLDLKADKSTAITHTGSQLQDYSGNNVYPNINQESIEDKSIVRNKGKYYQIEVNNLLNDKIFSLDKRVNYGWSGVLQDWNTYSDGRYTYMWIEIEYNKRYWGNPLAVWLFNSSQEYIATLDGLANVFKNFDIPDNSNIYYACIMYPAVTTNPIFRKTSVEIQDKIYDNGLFLKPNNFNIYTKCHRIQSFDEIVDFSGASTSTGVVALDDNKTYFSKNAKLCYATKTSGVSSYTVTKTARIENWKSMTFVFYIPYETWLGSTANSGYIQGYINGNVNYGWFFNGRYKWGWNFIKIRKSDIANAPTHVTSITITLNPRGSVSNGDNFGYITLDSVIFNMKMKPCVLLNFDHIYQESIDNGGYDLLFNNHIKFTMFTHGFNTLTNNQKEIARKFVDELNCEIGSYGGANSNNTIINGDSYTLLQKYNDLMSLRSEFSQVFYGENYSYATSQAKLTPKMENAIMQSGFKYIRALSGLPMTYFDNNCNWIVHIEFSTLTYSQIKKLIDDAIEYGDCLPLFTHGIANDTDSQISSTSIPLSIMTQVIDYLHTKISNGEIECLTFDEFYHSCTD